MDIIDESIISGIKKRDSAAFDNFVERYGGLVRAVVRRHLAGIPDAQEECINDILLAVWRNIDRYDPEKNSLKNWVAAIGKYRCIDYKRRLLRREKTENIDDITIPVNDVYDSLREDAESLLAALPEEDRQLFYRRYIIGESVHELAKARSVSDGWIYNRLSRGRRRLKNGLGKK